MKISIFFFSGKEISANVPTAIVFILGNPHQCPDHRKKHHRESSKICPLFLPHFPLKSPHTPGWGIPLTTASRYRMGKSKTDGNFGIIWSVNDHSKTIFEHFKFFIFLLKFFFF